MAKSDRDLFDHLRRAGLRKRVAKTLSELGEGAGKKAAAAARSTASELRSLADEIERRLPSAASTRPKPATAKPATAKPATRAAAKSAARTRARSAAKPAPRPTRPSGANKPKILASLKAGPKTASEVAKETGIATSSVGSALTRMAAAGEVVKDQRGYRLPS